MAANILKKIFFSCFFKVNLNQLNINIFLYLSRTHIAF
jgi:hypothetical protein